MKENEPNKNQILIETIKNICVNCKFCEVLARDKDTGAVIKVKARYCKDGTGYIDITLYDENDKYLETCKLKHPTDGCVLPYNLEVINDPDCECE
jgi:hypothetical protein